MRLSKGLLHSKDFDLEYIVRMVKDEMGKNRV